MPLDHYVSQVHLRKFCSQVLGNHRLYAIRKSDLKVFAPRPEDVCRLAEGSTNAYLREARAIEEFLKTIEPNYNTALEKLVARAADRECIYTIAGFVVYVSACSPAGMRMRSELLRSVFEPTAAIMEAQGALPPPPAKLGDTSLTQLLRGGTVEVTIDAKFSQAIGIQSILRMTALFGNFEWEILHNDSDHSPFLTSDFPVAIETTADPRILNRVIPLAPNLALRIRPDLSVDRDQVDLSFTTFRHSSRRLGHDELVRLNRLFVRCAENTVFYLNDLPWVHALVTKNRRYRIEPKTRKLRTPAGTLLVWTQRVVGTATLSRSTKTRSA